MLCSSLGGSQARLAPSCEVISPNRSRYSPVARYSTVISCQSSGAFCNSRIPICRAICSCSSGLIAVGRDMGDILLLSTRHTDLTPPETLLEAGSSSCFGMAGSSAAPPGRPPASAACSARHDPAGQACRHRVWKNITPPGGRSEEHTSELQSRENLVCRLLLEKKNKTNN